MISTSASLLTQEVIQQLIQTTIETLTKERQPEECEYHTSMKSLDVSYGKATLLVSFSHYTPTDINILVVCKESVAKEYMSHVVPSSPSDGRVFLSFEDWDEERMFVQPTLYTDTDLISVVDEIVKLLRIINAEPLTHMMSQLLSCGGEAEEVDTSEDMEF